MRARGLDAEFRATGQTGILIAGAGVRLAAVPADLGAGAVEALTPEAAPGHWDLIEGQGSLSCRACSGLTLALLHGGQPDALLLCHAPAQTSGDGLPAIEAARERALATARVVNPAARVIGVSVDTKAMAEADALAYLGEVARKTGLPATDPLRFGAGRLADALAGL